MRTSTFLILIFLISSCNVYKEWQPTLPVTAEKPIETGKEITSKIEQLNWDWNKTRVISIEGEEKYSYTIWHYGNKSLGGKVIKKDVTKTDITELYLNDKSISSLKAFELAIKTLPNGTHYVTIIGNVNRDLYSHMIFWQILESTPNSHKAKIISYYKGTTALTQVIFKKR
tara:strand:- start:2934 stop:3446 length:513 start_codon:yes stop_codon:yes gene_type:complete